MMCCQVAMNQVSAQQWLGSATDINDIYRYGNVGIGTNVTAATYKLDVSGGDINLWNGKLRFNTLPMLVSTGNNTKSGIEAGLSLTSGQGNSFSGYYTGKNYANSSDHNTLTGYYSGINGVGNNNSYYGSQTGLINNGSDNTFIGKSAGSSVQSGNNNTLIGSFAGGSTITFGDNNTFLGAQAGQYITGPENTIIGSQAGNYNGGAYNYGLTLLGFNAQRDNTAIFFNNATAIGANALVSKSDALVLGNRAFVGIGTSEPYHALHIMKIPGYGNYNILSDSRLNQGGNCKWDNAGFIVGHDYAKALFVQKGLECQTNGPTQETFHVYGNGWVEAAAYGTFSDKRFKKDIKTIENPIELIKRLDGVRYKFNFELEKNPNADGKPTLGFIAQEVEKVLPDAVFKNTDGYYSLNYDAIIPVLTNGIKEQQKLIESQQKQLEELQAVVAGLTSGSTTTGGIQDGSTTTQDVFLGQNVPNPFSQNTVISYRLPANSQQAFIGIYDINGKEATILPLGKEREGTVTIEAGNMPSGMYVYSLIVNGVPAATKRMVITSH